MTSAEERGAAVESGWLGAAMGIAIVSGVYAALALMRGRFAAGGIGMLVSLVALRRPHSMWGGGPDTDLSPRQRRIGVLAACVLAVFFRTYHLEPPGLWGDEAVNGLRAFDILDGKVHSPFELVEQPLTYFHALSNYPIAATFWAFGAGPVTLRVPGIVAGILDVPLLYATVAPLFGSGVALVSAWFVASSAWQICHAKGITQIEFGEFFLLLGMCAVVRGSTGRQRWLIPLAGVPFAACLYTYHAAKLAPLVPLVFLGAALWSGGDRRRLMRASGGFLLVLVLCAIPAVRSYMEHPGALTERVSGVALPSGWDRQTLSLLWDSVWRTLMIFQYQQGPIYNWFGIGTDPALDLILAFLFVHGVVHSLRHCTEPGHTLLLGWFIVGLLPGFLSTEAPRAYRVLLASPPVYVWAAMPVAYLYRDATHFASRRWVRGAVVLILLAVPLIDFNYYFYRVYTHAEYRWYQAARMLEMARALQARGHGWRGALLAEGFPTDYETLSFLSRAWGLTLQEVSSLADVLPVRDDPEGGVLCMMDRTTLGALTALRSLYPAVEPEAHSEPRQRTWWFDAWLPLAASESPPPVSTVFFPVSRQAAAGLRGITMSFFAADGTPMATRVESQPSVEGPQDFPGGSPAAVRWSGAVYAPVDGVYGFSLRSNGRARVWIDGEQVASNDAPEATRALAQGLHPIAAEATDSAMPVLRLQWRPPGGELQPIPQTLLFRSAEVHGLLAEYEGEGRKLRRIEPYPYYAFFPDTFTNPFSVRWRGRVRVPAPGGYQLEVINNGQRHITIDGRAWQPGDELAAGVHEFDMRIDGVREAAHLRFYWGTADVPRDLVPPEAFTPPQAVPR